MTTEDGKSDAPRVSDRRGLSRRQMIKASAVAGAAAWTAPVIIDSLASPAAAMSVCKPYWVKLTTAGNCFPQCYDDSVLNFALGGNPPGSGSTPDQAKFGGDCSYPGLVFHEGLLYMSYYSSHEGKTSIYLAKIKLP